MLLLNEKLAEVLHAEREARLERHLQIRRAVHELREARLEARALRRQQAELARRRRGNAGRGRTPFTSPPRPGRSGRKLRGAPVTVHVRAGQRHHGRRRGMG